MPGTGPTDPDAIDPTKILDCVSRGQSREQLEALTNLSISESTFAVLKDSKLGRGKTVMFGGQPFILRAIETSGASRLVVQSL